MTDHVTARGGPLRPGDPAYVGPYTLLGRLGSGGMGVVFLARSPSGELVAVKLIHAELADDDEFRRRFRAEVAGARQVPPFCTAEVLDADPDAPRPYLVVEYVDGPSLFDVVRDRGPLSSSNVHSVAIGVATALAAIHDAGIIHRDLKPQNVLLAPGSPKVIDFGIARAREATSQLTRSGVLMGTVSYMSPERFGDDAAALTPAADVFAWGCVVAFAATGRAPFDADSPVATAARIVTQPPDLTGLTGPLRRLVELSLARDPRDRPTARHLLDLLLGSGPQRAPQISEAFHRQPALRKAAKNVRVPAKRPPSPARDRKVQIIILATLAAVVLAGAGITIGRRAAGVADFVNDATNQSTPPPIALTLPTGKPFVSDALTVAGQWNGTFIEGEEGSNCDVTDGALRAHRDSPGFYTCAGPEKELSGDHTIAVTGTIEEPGTCLAVWLYWKTERSYQLTACTDTFRVAVERDGEVRYVVRETDLGGAFLGIGEPVRLQVVVRDGVVRFGHDDQQLVEAELPEAGIDKGRPMIGLISEPRNEIPPYGASFNDIEIRTLS